MRNRRPTLDSSRRRATLRALHDQVISRGLGRGPIMPPCLGLSRLDRVAVVNRPAARGLSRVTATVPSDSRWVDIGRAVRRRSVRWREDDQPRRLQGTVAVHRSSRDAALRERCRLGGGARRMEVCAERMGADVSRRRSSIGAYLAISQRRQDGGTRRYRTDDSRRAGALLTR